jgi:hypothetical protein
MPDFIAVRHVVARFVCSSILFGFRPFGQSYLGGLGIGLALLDRLLLPELLTTLAALLTAVWIVASTAKTKHRTLLAKNPV